MTDCVVWCKFAENTWAALITERGFISLLFEYLRSVLRASVMVLQRFSRASRRWGSSFRNFTASTSTLSTTRILLWRLGNWSAQGGEERGISENRKLCVREICWNVDVRRNRAGEQGRREEADYREGDIKGRRDAVSVTQDFPVISRWFLWEGLSGGQLNKK